MNLICFEDSSWTAFAPLSLTRPVFALASGAMTLLQRQVATLKPDRLTLWVREELTEFTRQRIAPTLGVPVEVNRPLGDEPAVLVNAAMLRGLRVEEIPGGGEAVAMAGQTQQIAWALVRRPGLRPADVLTGSDAWAALTGLSHEEPVGDFAFQIADVIHANEGLIQADFELVRSAMTPCPVPSGFSVVAQDSVRVGSDVRIGPGVVLDASNGPILLADACVIGANSVIEGPCYIGQGTAIRPMSLIRNGMTIGPSCKIGGEVAESIIQGYTNKVHDGYLGHSFLGQCVNLGAGTTTSNLKNTYGQVELRIGSRHVKTGQMFMGSVIGDHTKTAILTRLMTGTYVGVSSMIACSAHAPKCVPSFTFLTDEGAQPYQMDKAIEVGRHVYARRKREWTQLDDAVLAYASRAAATAEA